MWNPLVLSQGFLSFKDSVDLLPIREKLLQRVRELWMVVQLRHFIRGMAENLLESRDRKHLFGKRIERMSEAVGNDIPVSNIDLCILEGWF